MANALLHILLMGDAGLLQFAKQIEVRYSNRVTAVLWSGRRRRMQVPETAIIES